MTDETKTGSGTRHTVLGEWFSDRICGYKPSKRDYTGEMKLENRSGRTLRNTYDGVSQWRSVKFNHSVETRHNEFRQNLDITNEFKRPDFSTPIYL